LSIGATSWGGEHPLATRRGIRATDMTARVVALDLPGGPGFVVALRWVWDRGDAAFPIDQRLPAPARAALLDAMAPTSVIDTHGEEHSLAGGRPVDDGDALVMATSGATGEPKGVVLTHDAVVASARVTSDRLGVTDSDHWLACLPLSHIGGLAVVTRALHTRTTLTVLPRFDADEVEAAGATLVSLVATTLTRIDTERFRVIVLGGSAAPAGRPPNAVVTYGMTETGSGVVYDACHSTASTCASMTTARSTSAGRCCCGRTATAGRHSSTAGWPREISVAGSLTVGCTSMADAATSSSVAERMCGPTRWNERYAATRSSPTSP